MLVGSYSNPAVPAPFRFAAALLSLRIFPIKQLVPVEHRRARARAGPHQPR